MKRSAGLLAAVALIAAVATVVRADDSLLCFGDDNEGRIRGCTALIDRGGFGNEKLAEIYARRALAYSLLGQYSTAIRDYDVAARFGGDEFCVLLPETELEGARVVAERMRALVEESTARSDAPVTISIGAVSYRGPGATPDELLGRADRAAYYAKASGRNAVAAAPVLSPAEEADRILRDLAVD